MQPNLSVVIPSYNEAENLPRIIHALRAYQETIDFQLEVIFVDDGSSDNSKEVIKQEAEKNGLPVRLVSLSRNFGMHAAIRAGVSKATAENCMFYYVDMSEPIDVLGEFYHKLTEGYDLVYSEREGYKGSLGSRIFSKLVVRYIEKTYPVNGVSCVAFNRKVMDELNRNPENNSSIFFQLFQMGFRKAAIPVKMQEREKGKSKWTLAKKVKLFVDSFVMYSYMPIRAISILGITLSILGFLWALFVVIGKVFNLVHFSAGWPTLFALLLLGFGMTNISLGVISEYLVRTLDASRNRPVYLIADVTDIGERID